MFPWFSPCARKGRTSRSHRKYQRILPSMFRPLPSRRRAPRQAENQRHDVQKHHPKKLENASNFILFWSPGALPETKPQKCSPAGSPGGSGALLAPLPEAEIDQLSAPRGPQEAPHELFRPPGQERFEALPAATLGPHGAQKLPGSLRTLILDPPPPLPWSIFHSFSEISGLLF